MNRKLERGFLEQGEISPAVEKHERPEKVRVSLDTTVEKDRAAKVKIHDSEKAEALRLNLEIEQRLPEIKGLVERGERIRQEYLRLEEYREKIEAGASPDMFTMMTDLEFSQLNDGSLGSSEAMSRELAKKHFQAFILRLRKMEMSGQGERDVLQEVSNKFFVETNYHYDANSLVEGLTGKESKMNCEGKFKAIASTLESLGYDPKEDISIREYADHVKAMVKTADGTWLEFDGPVPMPSGEEADTVTMPLHDYKRILVGLDPERMQGGEHLIPAHEGKRAGVPGLKDRILARFNRRPVQHRRMRGVENLQSLETGMSFVAHLMPEFLTRIEALAMHQVFSALEHPQLKQFEKWMENSFGYAVDAARKAKKTAMLPKTRKIAFGAASAVAMFSAYGPVKEKMEKYESPEQAAEAIGQEVKILQAVMEEKQEEAAQVVEEVKKNMEKHADDFAKRFESLFKPKPLQEKEEAPKEKASQEKTTWNPALFAEVMPTIVMTSEEFYRFQAEQEYVFSVSDFAMRYDMSWVKDPVNNDSTVVNLSLEHERVISPSFWKFALFDIQEAALKRQETLAGSNEAEKVKTTFASRTDFYLDGEHVDLMATVAALEAATDSVDGVLLMPLEKPYGILLFDAHDKPLYKYMMTKEGPETMFATQELEDEYEAWSQRNEWRDAVSSVPDQDVVRLATQIAQKMGDHETVIHPKENMAEALLDPTMFEATPGYRATDARASFGQRFEAAMQVPAALPAADQPNLPGGMR